MKKTFNILMMVLMLFLIFSVHALEITSFEDLRGFAPQGTFKQPDETSYMGEMSYRSQDISINIEKLRVDNSDVYVADIYLTSAQYFRRAFSNNKWAANSQKVRDIVQDSQALLAITGDYSSNFGKGLVVGNGEIFRESTNSLRHNCLIYYDGRFETFGRNEMDLKEVELSQVWQSFLFGPELLEDDGKPFESFDSKIGVANPRTVLGYFSPGHYCFVVVDGRGNGNRGMKLTELSLFMSELGCKQAYNLDGGQSTVMVFNGNIVNTPYKGGRPLTDMVYIGE